MNLDYNILFFEDDKHYLNTFKKTVNGFFEDLGFNLVINKNVQENKIMDIDIEDYFRNNEVDLILIDYNLDNSIKGNTIINKIRSHSIYTEILFYSVDSKYRNKVKDQFEGVYYSSRVDLETKLKEVVNVTLNKYLDINNMRGLFIAVNIDISSQMDNILFKIFEIKDMKKELFENSLLEKEFFSDGIKYDIIWEILRERQEFLKAELLPRIPKEKRKIIKELFDEYNPVIDVFKELKKEVLEKRNKLAHAKKDPTNRYNLITDKGTICFDTESCKFLRKTFQKHIDNLTLLEEKIEEIMYLKENQIFLTKNT